MEALSPPSEAVTLPFGTVAPDPGDGDRSDPFTDPGGVVTTGFSGCDGDTPARLPPPLPPPPPPPLTALLWARLSGTLGFSPSSFRKLERSKRVLSATEGGFSGRGGAGPLPPGCMGGVEAVSDMLV